MAHEKGRDKKRSFSSDERHVDVFKVTGRSRTGRVSQPDHSSDIVRKRDALMVLFSSFFLFLMLFPLSADAGYRGDIYTQLTWGSGEGELGILSSYDAIYGPSSFTFNSAGNLVILDMVNSRIQEVDVEQGQVTYLLAQLQPGPDRPDLLWLERRLLSCELAKFPAHIVCGRIGIIVRDMHSSAPFL